MQIELNTVLAAAQNPDGGFDATVCRHNVCLPDSNGFITALLLRSLGYKATLLSWSVRERALDYLATCAMSDQRGAYNFYPFGQPPAWMDPPLANDADDTAIMALERLKAGRVSRAELIKTTCVLLDTYRLPSVEPLAPPWMQSGVFLTWLRGPVNRNMVDCCVNANVIALYASLGLHRWRGYAEGCALIGAGVEWAGTSLQRARTLCPFYPDPLEFRYAVEQAVAQGAARLEPVLKQLLTLPWAQTPTGCQLNRPVCSSAYGGVTWYAPILQFVRHHLATQKTCLLPTDSKQRVSLARK